MKIEPFLGQINKMSKIREKCRYPAGETLFWSTYIIWNYEHRTWPNNLSLLAEEASCLGCRAECPPLIRTPRNPPEYWLAEPLLYSNRGVGGGRDLYIQQLGAPQKTQRLFGGGKGR
jgi:hypothetical protein